MLVTWRYRIRRSLVQWFDPRAWLIFYACFLAAVLMFWDLRYLAPLFVLAMVAVLTSGVAWHEVRRPVIFILGFILIYAFFTFLTGRGGEEFYEQEHLIRRFSAPFTILGLRLTVDITVERLAYALSQFIRVLSLGLMTIIIPYTLNPSLYGVAFHGLGMPDKFAYAMDLTMRFIPTFGRDFSLTMDAQRARGYELEKISGGLVAQVRKLGPLIVPVTIHAIVGAEDIIDAMDLRAFGTLRRTWIDKLTYRRRDYALIAFGVLIFATALALSVLGYGRFWVPPFLLPLAAG
jgi:energy-coupling factor transport system permease protein